MGAFFGSVQVRSDDRERVMEAAEQIARERRQKCLVGPALDGWTGIYPENSGQDESFGQAVAARVGADVLHLMVHDDDIMAYWCGREGKLLDSYWSRPGYFGEDNRESEEARKGHPELLSQLAAGDSDELRRILARDESESVEGERLRKLGAVLGISNVMTAYEYLKAGERHGISGWRQFVEIPRDEVAHAQRAGRLRRQQINATIKRMKASGLLLLREVRKRVRPQAARAADGLFVAYYGCANSVELKLYGPPWQAGTDASIATGSRPTSVAADGNGERVALALEKGFAVWNVTDWQRVAEIFEENGGYRVALSLDGRLLACGGRDRTVVVDVESGRNLATLPGHSGWLAFHPDNRWLVTTPPGGLRVTELSCDRPRESLFFIGGRYLAPSWVADATAQSWRRTQKELADTEKVQSRLQAMLDQIQTTMKRGHRHVSEDELARLRADAEKRAKDYLVMIKHGPPERPARSNEHAVTIGFTSDGRWLWCGTDRGLRVYAWDAVLAAKGEDMPEPAFHSEPASGAEVSPIPKGYVYAAVEEPDGKGLLFGGINGRLYRMDLGAGQVRDLLAMPEDEPIVGLVLSRDARALGIVSSLHLHPDGAKRDDRHFWNVLSYEKL